MSIQIRIVTPTNIAFEGTTDMVTGPGFHGEFGVLEHHARFLTLNAPGIIRLGKAQDQEKFVVGKGFAEVTENVVTYLVDSCIAQSAITGSVEEYLASLQN